MVTPQSQRRVQDRYALQHALGRGGMGVVWLAEDSVLQRKVAVKEMEFPAGVPTEEIASLKARVMREARAAGRLNHPNVTTIFDVVTDDSGTWIVMEYVDAPTLTEVVKREGTLSVERTVEVGLALLSALEAAHAAGIVHRDVKPGNVMVKPNGNVKLADFGVAAMQGDPKITMTGLIIGSPSYMAPEQAKEGVSGPASDMWGLGATLYYALEGQPPFDKGAAIPTLTAVSYEAPRPMQNAGALGPIIDRLLSKDPDQRPTAGELHTLLGEVAGAPAASAGGGAGAAQAVSTEALPPTSKWFWDQDGDDAEDGESATLSPTAAASREVDDPVETGRRRSPWPWVIAAAVLLLIAGLTLPSLLSTDEQPAARRDPQNDQPAARDNQPDPDAAAVQDEEPAEEPEEEAPVDQATAPPTEEATQAPAEEDAAAVPPDWSTFTIGGTASTVAHPPDWETVPRAEKRTDLVDPDGGRYLRVEYTDEPGDDAVAAWESSSDAFAKKHSNYSEISIEPYEYGNSDAALWEYTYEVNGTQLHAYNLAIVTGGRGYALNFQTREDQWDESQEMWEQFVASFEPSG